MYDSPYARYGNRPYGYPEYDRYDNPERRPAEEKQKAGKVEFDASSPNDRDFDAQSSTQQLQQVKKYLGKMNNQHIAREKQLQNQIKQIQAKLQQLTAGQQQTQQVTQPANPTTPATTTNTTASTAPMAQA